MFEGKFVNLRALEEEDLKTLKTWRNSVHIRKTTREYRMLDMMHQNNWFNSIHVVSPPKDIMFGVMDKKNKLIGVTGLTYIDWKNRHAEISVYLHSKDWQKTKEAKDVLNLIMGYGFGELNLHRLWAEIFSIATENIKLFEKLKFVKEGLLRDRLWRQGKWWDSAIYSKLSTEYANEQKN